MNLLTVLLQAAKGFDYSQLLMIVGIFVVFYFFMIRPQQKKQKEIKKFQDSIQSGLDVITTGGIYGKVKDVKDNTVIVEIADNVRVKLDKASVFAVPSSDVK